MAAAILLAVPFAASAETVPAPQPGPGGAEKAPSLRERQQANAAKLAGLVRFVGESCKEAQPDYERFKTAVAAMGVELDALSKGELLMRSMGYTEAYRKDVETSCRKAMELFGEKGSVIPGLVQRKAS